MTPMDVANAANVVMDNYYYWQFLIVGTTLGGIVLVITGTIAGVYYAVSRRDRNEAERYRKMYRVG